MKREERIWVGVILILALVVFFKYFVFKGESAFTFERNFRSPSFTLQKKDINVPADFYLSASDKFPYAINRSIDELKAIYYSPENLQAGQPFVIPNASEQMVFCDKKKIFGIYKFDLYRLDLQNRKNKKIKIENLKLLSARPLPDKPNKFLLFGERKEKDKYETGFYIFDALSKKLKILSLVSTGKKSTAPESMLKYAGNFSLTDHLIIYVCNKYSKIYLFDLQGNFLKSIQTQDNAPAPTIIHNPNAYYYERGKTFNTNNGAFSMNDKLFVFSSRSNRKHKIVADVYSIESGKYLYSHLISYKGHNSTDINAVSKTADNKVMICFNKKLLMLNFPST